MKYVCCMCRLWMHTCQELTRLARLTALVSVYLQFDMQRITLEELKHILFYAFRDHLTMKDIENIIINEEESLKENSGNCQTEFEGGEASNNGACGFRCSQAHPWGAGRGSASVLLHETCTTLLRLTVSRSIDAALSSRVSLLQKSIFYNYTRVKHVSFQRGDVSDGHQSLWHIPLINRLDGFIAITDTCVGRI